MKDIQYKKMLKEVWNAYKDNLQFSLKYVDELIGHLDEKVIITSDHGNCFGEMGLFAYPRKVHIPPLVDVPLLEVSN